jgi:hypothetical protein
LQDARNFRGLFLGELHELVIALERFERLDKHGLSRGAGPMHDPRDATAVRGAHGDHVTVVAQRDVVLAGLFATSAQNAPELFQQFLARLRKSGADAAEFRRSVVADFSIGKNGVADGSGGPSKVRQAGGAGSEARIFFRLVPQCGFEVPGGVRERGGIEQLGRRQDVDAHREPREPRLRIREPPKTQFAPGAQPGRRFTNLGKGVFERPPLDQEGQRFQRAASGRTSGVALQDFPQARELENFFHRARHGDSR